MKILFQTKEQSNKAQEVEFLALTPTERFYRFLWLSERLKDFPTKFKKDTSKNFQIVIKKGCDDYSMEG